MAKPTGRDKSGRAPGRAREDKRTREPERIIAPPPPEFSRPVNVARIGRLDHQMEIAANAEERAALARRFDLIALESLAASLVLKKRGDGVVEVSGTYRARLAQPCVVTLEPVWATIEEEVRLFFSGGLGNAARKTDHAIDDMTSIDDEGTPEPIVNGVIDLGEAVAQLMALALDPYPRAPGASTTG